MPPAGFAQPTLTIPAGAPAPSSSPGRVPPEPSGSDNASFPSLLGSAHVEVRCAVIAYSDPAASCTPRMPIAPFALAGVNEVEAASSVRLGDVDVCVSQKKR